VTRIDRASFAEIDRDQAPADAAGDGALTESRSLKPSSAADLRRLDDYVGRWITVTGLR